MELKRKQYSSVELFKTIERQLKFETEIKWSTLISISLYHVVALYWIYFYAFPAKWQSVVFACVMYAFTGSGISCGAHRYWTHRSYKATLPLRIYLLLAFASSGQNSIYNWVRDHRVHHKYSDTEADPHDSTRGFWFSHIGWLCMKKKSIVIEKGKQMDMSDIERDPVAMFDKKNTFWLRVMFCFVLPILTGVWFWGESWRCAVAWQCFIRYLIILHGELSVNSFAHMYGSRPFNKNIKPTQNLYVSLFTIGEGGHNYHHTFPYDYRSEEFFDYVNFSSYFIKTWSRMGLAYDLKRPSPELVQTVLEKQKIEAHN